MTLKTKAAIYYLIILIVFYLVIWFLLHYIFPNLNTIYVSVISASVSAALSPQKKVVKTQSGEYIQLKWIFSKKVINIK